jgi:hypothetical protein
LLLGPDHGSWKGKIEASLAPHRVVAGMPIKVRHLLEILGKILPSTPRPA